MLVLWLFVGALSITALVVHVLLILQNWEFRRFVRSRLNQGLPAHWQPSEHVAVFVPVKGKDPDIEANLLALFHQDYPRYELVFVVQSDEDPAAPLIRELIASNPAVPARLLVAGIASRCGQKVYNLLAATANLGKKVEVLAFVDADARPEKHWLKTLICRLHAEGNGAATGYRWFMPQRTTLPNWLHYSINSSAADMLGRHSYNLIWGGTWAIRRRVFESLELRSAWQGTLSDDLVASRVLRSAGYRIEFEPACLVASPVDVSFAELCEFLRRQLVIARHYTPRYWFAALLFNSGAQAGFWVNLFLVPLLMAMGQRWWLCGVVAGLLYIMSVVRSLLRQNAVRDLFPRQHRHLPGARWFDIWAAPIAAALGWLLLISSSFGSTIRWRGIRYVLQRGQIRSLCRSNDYISSSENSPSGSNRRAA